MRRLCEPPSHQDLHCLLFSFRFLTDIPSCMSGHVQIQEWKNPFQKLGDDRVKYMEISNNFSSFFSLVPCRQQSTKTEVAERGPYSPFKIEKSNKVDYALARVDDLINWGRKVMTSNFISFDKGCGNTMLSL